MWMGIRVTGISTPVGGVSWEYTKAEEHSTSLPISPGQKIKVFISSICGVEKYDKVRADLKSAIESTQLADAYTFESTIRQIICISPTGNQVFSFCHTSSQAVQSYIRSLGTGFDILKGNRHRTGLFDCFHQCSIPM